MGDNGRARKIYGWQDLWWYYEDQYLVVRLPVCICKTYIKISSFIVTLEIRITMCWGKKGIHLQGPGFLIWPHPSYPHPDGHAEKNLFLFSSVLPIFFHPPVLFFLIIAYYWVTHLTALSHAPIHWFQLGVDHCLLSRLLVTSGRPMFSHFSKKCFSFPTGVGILCIPYYYFFLHLLVEKYVFIGFQQRWREWGWGREKEKHGLVASCTHLDLRSNLKPGYMPWHRIKPVIFWCTGQCSMNWAIWARAGHTVSLFLQSHCTDPFRW